MREEEVGEGRVVGKEEGHGARIEGEGGKGEERKRGGVLEGRRGEVSAEREKK